QHLLHHLYQNTSSFIPLLLSTIRQSTLLDYSIMIEASSYSPVISISSVSSHSTEMGIRCSPGSKFERSINKRKSPAPSSLTIDWLPVTVISISPPSGLEYVTACPSSRPSSSIIIASSVLVS